YLHSFPTRRSSDLTPRGLLFHKQRHALFVADSTNHRIQIFDPETWQLTGIWGQPDYAAVPEPSSEPGRFHTPWSLSSDADGNVYVVDIGNRRVQKFDLTGKVIESFSETTQKRIGTHEPLEVASGTREGAIEIYLLAPS